MINVSDLTEVTGESIAQKGFGFSELIFLLQATLTPALAGVHQPETPSLLSSLYSALTVTKFKRLTSSIDFSI